MNQTAKQLAILLQTFNDKRVISQEEIQQVLTAITAILAENKKGLDTLTEESKAEIKKVLLSIKTEHESVLLNVTKDLTRSKADIEKATKAQNDRAFKRLQELIKAIQLPKDGKDGLDGAEGPQGPPGQDGKDCSPDTSEQVRDKLEKLKGEDRLDASAIKNLPKFIKEKGKELMVGGIRFLENLADVSVPVAKKREDLLIQYDETNKRWEDGVALTVSTTAPSNPQVGDIWIDSN
jgi:hypothetical protein